jgi:hypothetical protein
MSLPQQVTPKKIRSLADILAKANPALSSIADCGITQPVTFAGKAKIIDARIHSELSAVHDKARYSFIEEMVRIYDSQTDKFLTIADFRALTSNYAKVRSGEKSISFADAWLSNPDRPQYRKVVYDPSYVGTENLNRWTGWAYQPIAGDVTPFVNLLRHVVGDDNLKQVLHWFAYPIQHPGKRPLFALVLVSNAHGLGKGLLVKTVGKLHGKGFKTPTVGMVTGTFNGWLSECTFAVGEEFSIEGNRGLMARLKELITEPQLMINEKNLPAYMADILAACAFLTNDHGGLHIEPNDRRFFVIDCTNAAAPSSVYDKFVAWRDSGGMNSLMHYLLNLDLSDYKASGHAPSTAAKSAMAELTSTDLERWLKEYSNDAPKAVYTRQELKQAFESYSNTRSTESAVGRALKRLGLGAESRINIGDSRPRVVAIRNPSEWIVQGASAWSDEYAGKNVHRKRGAP